MGLPAEPPGVILIVASVSPHMACITLPTSVGAGVTVVFTIFMKESAHDPGGFILSVYCAEMEVVKHWLVYEGVA